MREDQVHKLAELSDRDRPHTDPALSEKYMFSEEHALLLETMRANATEGSEFWRECYSKARDDVSFIYDEQWDAGMMKWRKDRPKLQLNVLPQYVARMTGTARQTKHSIHVIQKAGLTGEEAALRGERIPTHELMGGIIRDIEARSDALQHYYMAFQHAVEGGFGWLRIRIATAYDDPFSPEIWIEYVKNRWSVLMDPHYQKPDMSDSRWGMIEHRMRAGDFRARWPHVSQNGSLSAHFSGLQSEYGNYWYNEEAGGVMVLEYFWREPARRKAMKLRSKIDDELLVVWEDEVEYILDELIHKKTGEFEVEREEEFDSYRMMTTRATGGMILEDPEPFPGSSVPIIPVVGRQIDMDGKTYFVSVPRYAADPQRMVNYWASAATERVARSPGTQWLASDDHIADYEDEWADDQILQKSVLIYTAIEGMEGPKRYDSSAVPQGELALVQLGMQLVQESIGLHDAWLGKNTNDESGVAIARRQNAGDAASFDYIDNLGNSIQRTGEICCEVAPAVYSEEKVQRLKMRDGNGKIAKLNVVEEDEETGIRVILNNLSLSRFKVQVTVGPSFITQRQEVVAFLTEIGKNLPESMRFTLDLLVKYMDVAGGEEIVQRLRWLVPRHMLSKEEQELVPPPEPTPAEQVEMMKAQAEQADSQSVAQVAQINLQIAQTKLEEANVKLREAIINAEQGLQGEGEGGSIEQIMPMIESLVKEVVAQALAEKGD